MSKTIILCLAGKSFSNNFLLCWSNLLHYCHQKEYKVLISNSYNPNIYFVRNECLGADISRGITQKPFDGKIDYDYLFWIDSDILFSVEQFEALLNMNTDIATGCYLMADGNNYAIVEKMNPKYFKEHFSYQFLNRDSLKDKSEPFEVDYAGMGFMCIKKGVFESLQYPFFKPSLLEYNVNGQIIRDYASEDVSFCMDIRNQGFSIICNPNVIVGHEKNIILD